MVFQDLAPALTNCLSFVCVVSLDHMLPVGNGERVGGTKLGTMLSLYYKARPLGSQGLKKKEQKMPSVDSVYAIVILCFRGRVRGRQLLSMLNINSLNVTLPFNLKKSKM